MVILHKSIRNIVFTPTPPEADIVVAPTKPVSYLNEVCTGDTDKDGTAHYSTNACRFATKAEALAYGAELASRWTLVVDHRAQPSQDPVNYEFRDGKARSLDGPSGPA